MASGKTLTVYLAADLSKFNGNLNKASGSLTGLQKGLLAAGAAAAVFAVNLAVDAAQAAMQEEQELTKLNKTLENLGFDKASGQVNTFIDDMQFASGVADSELRPAFDRLVRSTGSVGEAQRALQIALDTSVGTGKSLESVANALGKAYDGNTTALGRLGIGIDKATLASGNLQEITATMAETFKGQSASAAQTLAGRMDRLKIASDELIEAFGTGLVGAADDSTAAMNDATQAMRDAQPAARRLGDLLNNLALGAINVGDNFLAMGTAISSGNWDLVRRMFFATDQELKNLNREAFSAGKQFEYLQYAAYGAAAAMAQVTPAVRQVNEHNFRATETATSFAGALEKVDTSTKSYGATVEKVNPQMEAQTGRISDLIQKLIGPDGAIDALNKATNAFISYRNAISGNLLKGISLKDVFQADDVQGSYQRFLEQIKGVGGFSTALNDFATGLGDSEGAKALLNNFLELGADGASSLIAGFTPEMTNNLVSELDKTITASEGTAFLLAKKFYGEGIEGAQQTVDGYIVQIAKEEKRLRQIGKNIGKPIGANIKAEIADAVAEAVKAAEAAKTAAAAEKAAEAANKNVTVTEQQVAKALQQLIVNADKRSTGQVGVIQ